MADHSHGACCPLCGSDIAPDRLLVDLATNEIFVNSKWVRVSPKHAEILMVLAAANGTMVRYAELVCKVWGARSDIDDPAKSLAVHVHRLRRVLEGSQWAIVTSNERGFTLRRRLDAENAISKEAA